MMIWIIVGKLSLITLGPLTNVAMAIKLDANFAQCLKNFYFMGGNTESEWGLFWLSCNYVGD